MVDSHFNLIYDLMPAKKVSKPIVKPKEPELQKRLHVETTTKAVEEVKEPSLQVKKRMKKLIRKAGQETWVDETLEQWPENDFRIFCGNMGNEVNDDVLANAFKKYPSFFKARVVKDKRTLKSKGFGFVSLTNVDDYIKAMREMQGKYVGNRPITLKKSEWTEKSAFNN